MPCARPPGATPPRCASRSTPSTRTSADAGQARVDLIGAFADVGIDRIISFPTKYDPTTDAQAAFAEDCVAAGVKLDGP